MREAKQKRMTRQKAVVHEVLQSTTSHPTADWIYREARKQIPGISLGTVYRNLQALLEEGQIMELNYGKGQSRFDGNAEQHYHFVCEKCGKVYDFAMDSPTISQEVLDAAPGLVKDYRFECYGICKDCLD
ncbi:MAG: transcriptional repressor [Clostridia bacterium]|nr:transcriptional repressor [Clostridia bacterium]